MDISVTCAVCQRTFLNIDKSMLGQKARCSCGTVVLLVADAHADEPELIEDIELLDNNEEELLFAQIKEADQTRSTP